MFRWFQETVSCAPVGSLFVFLSVSVAVLWFQDRVIFWASFCVWLWLCVVLCCVVLCCVSDTLLSPVFFFFILLNVGGYVEVQPQAA